ncbi:MAG: LacI family DNA-binding transcriptional regulator [Paenibacillaceae bacterium]
MKKSITIYDIAKSANTSAATVSRVLSNSNYPVSVEMKEKIKRIAKEVNYVPNISGRQLKTNKSMTIGVIVPSISNPFYSPIVLGIEETARKNGYHVLLCNSLQSPELENEYIQTLFQKQVQGLIISSISGKIELLNSYISKGLNVVAIDQALDDLKDGFQIGFDYRKGGYLATEYLIKKGHNKIAYVTAPLDRPSRKDILIGYQEAMLKYGIEADKEWIQITQNVESMMDGSSYEFTNGKQLAKQILDVSDRPSAILACNDMTAIGMINELEQQGIKVPEQMSIIGIDNIELGQIISPSLSTIDHPKREMGKFACKMLLERMNGDKSTMNEMVMQPQMIERDSVRALKM